MVGRKSEVEAPRVLVEAGAPAAGGGSASSGSPARRGGSRRRAPRGCTGSRSRSVRRATSGRRPRRSRSRAGHVHRHGAEPLGAVQQHRHAGGRQRAGVHDRPVVQDTCEQATSRVRARSRRPARAKGATRTRTPRRSRSGASGASTPGCSWSLVTTSSPFAQAQRGEHRVHSVGGRAGERELGGIALEQRATRPRSSSMRARSASNSALPARPSRVWRSSESERPRAPAPGPGPFVPAFR